MSFAGAVLLILTGLAILSFGLFLFYAWLPLLYGLVGFDIGLLLGRSLTGDVGTTAIVLGLAVAIALGAASYFLEPYRRILLGVSGGVLVGLSLAAVLDLDTMLGAVMARLLVLFCGVLGGILVPRFFDAFIIGSSAFSGAVMTIMGARHLFPNLGLFDIATGGPLPTALAVVLTLLGVIWQSRNIAKWAGVLPIADRGPPG